MAKHKPIVIIPTYNRKDFILKHIALLKQQTLVPDILIVDNASTDGTAEAVENIEGVTLLRMEENLGPGGAYYAGQKYALKNGYEIIINADDDALPTDTNLIEKSVELINKGNRVVLQRRKLDKNKFQRVGVNWYGTFHRSVFEEIGIYNPLVPFFEDTEFEIRMRKAGISPVDSGCYVDHPVALGRISSTSFYYRLLMPLIVYSHHQMFLSFFYRLYLTILSFLVSFIGGPFRPSFYISLLVDFLKFGGSFKMKMVHHNYEYRKSDVYGSTIYIAVGGAWDYDKIYLPRLISNPKLTRKKKVIPYMVNPSDHLFKKAVFWTINNLLRRPLCDATVILTGNYHYLTTFLLDKATYGVEFEKNIFFLHSKNNQFLGIPYFILASVLASLLTACLSPLFLLKKNAISTTGIYV